MIFPMKNKRPTTRFTAMDFFAGSGLVTEAVSPFFNVIWANDVSAKKAMTYTANHGSSHFIFDDIKNIKGNQLPDATLAWASFPCQDLSLAGKVNGIYAPRSGLVWEWLRVLDELQEHPPLLVAENVSGLLSASKGAHYADLHNALTNRGYRVGPLLIDAKKFLPQSRPRVFIVAARKDISIGSLSSDSASWANMSKNMINLSEQLDNWVFWKLKEPESANFDIKDYIENDAPFPAKEWQDHNIGLIDKKCLEKFIASPKLMATGYKRVRKSGQALEIRYDGIAGCLRTPSGGSSKQFIIFKTQGGLKTRFLTVRETARLMGAPDSYKLPGTYLDGYKAMGDAVALPAARYLANYLLYPLAEAANYASKNQEAV
jgi:DNA (cytosine-5)-methyltransferase 1